MSTAVSTPISGHQAGLEHRLAETAMFVEYFPQYLGVLATRLGAQERSRVMREIEDGLEMLRNEGYRKNAKRMEKRYYRVLLNELERENPPYTIN